VTRKWTNKLIEVMEDGGLDPFDVVMACLSYMSEADVEDMCQVNDLNVFEDGDEDDDG
jgi:hypothetical protein